MPGVRGEIPREGVMYLELYMGVRVPYWEEPYGPPDWGDSGTIRLGVAGLS